MRFLSSQVNVSKVLAVAASIILFVAGGTNLVIGTIAATQMNVTAASAFLAAGLVLVLAASIERFDVLRGFGMEARTKKLERTIEEADRVLEDMKFLAELTGANFIRLNSRSNRFDGGPTPEQAYEEALQIRELLVRSGSSASFIFDAMQPFVRNLLFDLTLALLEPLKKELEEVSRKNSGKFQRVQRTDDPEYLAYLEERNVLHSYYERVGHFKDIYKWKIADHPQRLLEHFDSVPLIDQAKVASWRASALSFVPEIQRLRESSDLSEPKRWFKTIDDYRKRFEPGG